jgi:hypothetical protein
MWSVLHKIFGVISSFQEPTFPKSIFVEHANGGGPYNKTGFVAHSSSEKKAILHSVLPSKEVFGRDLQNALCIHVSILNIWIST